MVNLREAVKGMPMLQQHRGQVNVYVNAPVTPVPLSDFQEEDAETLYSCCFSDEERPRVFYDPVPACNLVLLYALCSATCRMLEDLFDNVRYTSTRTAVVQHFSGKGLGNARGRRMFIYPHEGQAEVCVMEDTRLVMLNTFRVNAVTDVAYYAFSVARHLGLDLVADPIFVAGQAEQRDVVAQELKRFAVRVYPVNASAEFNRHIVATTAGVPYDMVCALMKK